MVLYSGVLKQAADKKGSDLFILSGSRHEEIAVPVTGENGDNPGKTDGDGGRISDGMKELLKKLLKTTTVYLDCYASMAIMVFYGGQRRMEVV